MSNHWLSSNIVFVQNSSGDGVNFPSRYSIRQDDDGARPLLADYDEECAQEGQGWCLNTEFTCILYLFTPSD